MVSHTSGFFIVGVPSIVNVDLLNEVDTIVVCSAYGCIVVEVDVDAKVGVHECCIRIHFLHPHSSHKYNQVEKRRKRWGNGILIGSFKMFGEQYINFPVGKIWLV
jgi:hypothetical protein